MEKDIPIGSVGDVALSFSGGKAKVVGQVKLDDGAIAIGVEVTADAGAFIDQLEAIVAKAIPATAAIDPAVFGVIKAAVTAIQ